MGKQNQQKSHFRRRIFERYGLCINEGEYDFLVSRVKKNDKSMVQFLMKQSNRITFHIITFKNIDIVVAYDKQRSTLVTALPSVCKDVTQINSYITEIGDEV